METKFRVEKVVHKEVDTGGEELDESTTVVLVGDVISITIRGPSVELDNEFVPLEEVELIFKRPQKTLSTFKDVESYKEFAEGVEKEFGAALDLEGGEPVVPKPQKAKAPKRTKTEV